MCSVVVGYRKAIAAIAYLMLTDPPILNIPSDNEQVAVTDFQNIIFQLDTPSNQRDQCNLFL